MGWTGEHRGFVVEAYYENSRSVIATQTASRTRLVLGRNASVPDRKTILLWISNLQATGSTLSVEGNVPWAFDLFKGRRGVAGTVTRFKPV